MNRGGYSGGHGAHHGGHYGNMGGYNGGYGMGHGPGPMHNYAGAGMMGGGGGAGGGIGGIGGIGGQFGGNNITNSNDPKSKASRVFLGNLNTGVVKRPDIQHAFGKYGQILGISLHNGFGFVQYNNENSAIKAVNEEQGRVMASQPLDLRIASDPDKNRPKGFRKIQGESFSGYVDPHQLPVQPCSGANGNQPTRKRMKRFNDSTNIVIEDKKEADEPPEWQCSICKVKVQTAWQLIKHAHKTHDIQIFMEKPIPT